MAARTECRRWCSLQCVQGLAVECREVDELAAQRALHAVAHTQHALAPPRDGFVDDARQASVDDRRRPARLADEQGAQGSDYPASAAWRSVEATPRRSFSAAMTVRMNAGRSAGERDVTS